MKRYNRILLFLFLLISAQVLAAQDKPVVKIIFMDSSAGRTEELNIKKAFEQSLESIYEMDVFLLEEYKEAEGEMIPAADFILLISFSRLDNNLYISLKLVYADPVEKRERVVTSLMLVDRSYQSFIKNIPAYVSKLNWQQWFLKKQA